MQVTTREFVVETEDRIEIHDVTPEVRAAIEDSDATDGMVCVRTGHTSAALTTNEGEERLLQDMLEAFTDLVPPEEWYFHDQHHLDTDTQRNAFGHILASMVRRPVLVVLEDGDLRTGTHEDILFVEFDGPRDRTVDVAVLE